MSSSYLLDTNTVSYLIRRKDHLVRRHMEEVAPERICISAITEAELRFGLAKRPEATRLAALVGSFLGHVRILPWDSRAAECYAGVRSATERSGEPMAVMDLLIAAQALAISATLITSDRSFRRIKQLAIEDWTEE